jgi:hypothetical protein
MNTPQKFSLSPDVKDDVIPLQPGDGQELSNIVRYQFHTVRPDYPEKKIEPQPGYERWTLYVRPERPF